MTVQAPTITEEHIRPYPAGRLLVRKLPRPELTLGGIALTDNTREVSQVGVIIAISGNGAGIEGLSAGQIVIFSQYAARPCVASTILPDADDLVFLSERDVFAVVEDGQGAADSGKSEGDAHSVTGAE